MSLSLSLSNIIKRSIRSFLLNKNQVFFNRSLYVQRSDFSMTNIFLDVHHLQRRKTKLSMNRINEQVNVYIYIYKHAHVCVKRYNESSSTKQTSETYVWWHQKRKNNNNNKNKKRERKKETEML